MGWDQDSQAMDGLAEHRAYHTAEKHSQKLVRKHTQKYSDKTIRFINFAIKFYLPQNKVKIKFQQ